MVLEVGVSCLDHVKGMFDWLIDWVELTYCLHEWGTRRCYWGRPACGRSGHGHLPSPRYTAKDRQSVLAAVHWHGAATTARWSLTEQDRTASTSDCWGSCLLDSLLSDYLASRTAATPSTVIVRRTKLLKWECHRVHCYHSSSVNITRFY